MTGVAVLGLVLAGLGGFGVASRLAGHRAPAALRVGLAWPLGASAVAWGHFWLLLLSVPLHPLASLVPAILMCGFVRARDFADLRLRLETWVALVVLAAACVPAWISRAGVGFVDGDMLSIWARRALGYFELGGLWADPSLHGYSGYPHAVSLRIVAVLAQGGAAAEPLARHAAWLDAASIVLILGSLGAGAAGRIAAALAQAATIAAYPLVNQTWTGYADLPLALSILGCGAVLLRDPALSSRRLLFLAGLLAGIAAFTKREGDAFAASAGFAVLAFSTARGRALLFAAAATLVTAPEWVYRAVWRTSWPDGAGRPDWRRAPELVSAIVDSPSYLALAIPAASLAVVAALTIRRPALTTGRAVAAASCAAVSFCALQSLAIMASPMYLSVQIATALDRLLFQSLPVALAILVVVAGPLAPGRAGGGAAAAAATRGGS